MDYKEINKALSGKQDHYLIHLNRITEPIVKGTSPTSIGIKNNLETFKDKTTMDIYLLGLLFKVNPYIYENKEYMYD